MAHRRREYVPEREYRFDELPRRSQQEARRQEEDFLVAFDAPPEDLFYRYTVVPNAQSWEILRENFGRHLESILHELGMYVLMQKLAGAGYVLPILGDEGLDRAIAATMLGWDLPVFQPLPALIPFSPGPWTSPRIEGRRR